MLSQFHVQTRSRNEWRCITDDIERIVRESGIGEGICVVFVPHTTAAVTINENADPDVPRDMVLALNTIAPDLDAFRHSEGNSSAHAKTALVGPSVSIIVHKGRLLLGTWQGIWFTEFDGPRTRTVYVRVLGDR
jgi:secondary thiamine-phosphate synthase enzyme